MFGSTDKEALSDQTVQNCDEWSHVGMMTAKINVDEYYFDQEGEISISDIFKLGWTGNRESLF